MTLKKLALGCICVLFASIQAFGQCTWDGEKFVGDCPNPVQSAVPYLRITPDARSGALGDAGVALTPDANAINANAARLAFVEDELSLSATYTPWLRGLVRDVYLAYLGGYKKLDNLQTLGFSLRYFSLGDIQYTDINGNPAGDGRPNEFDIAVSYSRKLSDNFAASVTGRFIYSNLAQGQTVDNLDIGAGTSGAVDIGLSYFNEVAEGQDLAVGLAITNLGSKINYIDRDSRDETRDVGDFIPTNLAFGAAYTWAFDDYNKLTITAETNKLLIPTPLQPGDEGFDEDGNGIADHREKSLLEGVFGSFSDAPNPGEEWQEFSLSTGVEYWYADQFAIRAGYFTEHRNKGNRKHFTMGLGVRYNIFGINMSYLVPTNGNRNPLDNTLRFSLIFNFDDLSNADI